MAKITFVEPDGKYQEVEAQAGASLMQIARSGNVAGIEAECGGACACATCHIYIPDELRQYIPRPEQLEQEMIKLAFDVESRSRLGCQVIFDSILEGAIIHLPQRQR